MIQPRFLASLLPAVLLFFVSEASANVTGTVRGRAGSQRLAVTNAGTIPDRGLFGVFLPDGTRVGELDEEMVYESRPGDVISLGATSWRITDITHDRVLVIPAPGQPARLPFWRGDNAGRPAVGTGGQTPVVAVAQHDGQ